MPFGAKLKTVSKLASMNALYRDDVPFQTVLNNDSVLKTQNQAMVVILGVIRTKYVGGGVNSIQTPPPFPCPKARWFGDLNMDTTTKGLNKKGKTVYTYDHASAFAENANTFRGRCDDLDKYTSMENDLLNSANKPNPGGQAGTHGKLPVAPGLVHAAPAAQ